MISRDCNTQKNLDFKEMLVTSRTSLESTYFKYKKHLKKITNKAYICIVSETMKMFYT